MIHNPDVPPDLESLADEDALACPVYAITVTAQHCPESVPTPGESELCAEPDHGG